MMWQVVGSTKEGHVAVQIFRQRLSSIQRSRRCEQVEAVVVSVAASRRVRMCVWMMS